MPQVPYQGAPSVAPQDSPIPQRQVSTPLAAFGGATAEALQHLGGAVEGAGNELFARANAMQELNQQAQASEAVSKFTTDMGKKYADFTSLEGKNAVDGFQPFLDNVNSTRADYRQDLTSPYAQRFYDQESRNQQARLTMSAAMHAGQQNKAYVVGSSKAAVQAAGDQVAQIPDDPAIAQAALDKVTVEANHQADIQGLSPDARQELVTTTKSDNISQRIQGLSKTQPMAAQKLLEQYSKSGDLTGPDSSRLSDLIQKQQYTVGARNTASSVLAGNDTHFGEGVVDESRGLAAIRGVESGSRYGISTPTKDGDTALGAYQVKAENLSPWLKQAGMSDMSPQEFLQNKAAQDQLASFKWHQYMTDTTMNPNGTANRAAEIWFSGEHSKPGNTSSDGATTTPEYKVKFNAQLAQGASLKDLTDAGRAQAETQRPGDSVYGDYVTQHIELLHNQQERIQRDDEFNNQQTVDGALVTGMQGGKIPTTLQELTADPKVDAAFQGMKSSDQVRIMNQLARNAKGDVAMTPQRLQVYSKMYGDAINNPDEFLKEDVLSADLPIGKKQELLKLQAQVYKKADASPITSRALGVLGPQLSAAGLDRNDKDGFPQFVGALHDELEQYQSENKQPPKDKDIQLMGSRLLQKFGGGLIFSGTPMFQSEVPDEFRQKAVADPTWSRLGITPTDQDIQRLYIRQQYQQLYGKKASSPAQPKAPISE